MAASMMPRAANMASLLVVLACALTSVFADDEVTTSAEADVPEWATENTMHLTLSTSHGSWLPTQYAVIPLTGNMGLNESDVTRNVIQIEGNMIAADSSNYNKINEPDDVAYLSCDQDDSFIEPNKMLNDLMAIKPKAIVLYSTSKNWCSLSHGDSLSYTSIFSMADAAEASQTLGYLNGTSSGAQVQVSIAGNTTSDSDDGGKPGKSNSAVAMSILYSITGIITLLFLVIIATGAVRAHRYPERYGPRRAVGGRPRQSRAKGIARAVLETIPIVKFGDKTPTKPDPELELETATTDGHDAATQRTASNLSEERRPDGTTAVAAGADHDGVSVVARSSETVDGAEAKKEEHLGCSICTEDFKVGEDVRVLPCRHQFHPACIDPWLINVSGTCPLCRFDLRPDQPEGPVPEGSSNAGENSLPPPLALDGYENEGAHVSHRNRLSRIFDINRLRQATVEEQMEALRQMRAQTNEAEQQAVEGESRAQGSRLAERLKERFRIRTRPQSAEQRNC